MDIEVLRIVVLFSQYQFHHTQKLLVPVFILTVRIKWERESFSSHSAQHAARRIKAPTAWQGQGAANGADQALALDMVRHAPVGQVSSVWGSVGRVIVWGAPVGLEL